MEANVAGFTRGWKQMLWDACGMEKMAWESHGAVGLLDNYYDAPGTTKI